jgi:hypothetical protein
MMAGVEYRVLRTFYSNFLRMGCGTSQNITVEWKSCHITKQEYSGTTYTTNRHTLYMHIYKYLMTCCEKLTETRMESEVGNTYLLNEYMYFEYHLYIYSQCMY